tara:strand:+ start:343 stop:987 length:645 start_codon:yes stop_codon:yes gene_type:complete
MDLERVEEALASMKKYGFFVIENYWSEEKCQEALNELLDVSLPCFDVGQGGDLRLNRANQSLATAKEFLKDSFIQEVANRYSNCKRADRIVAGIVKQQQGKDIDSGGGWHVDSEINAQFKSFIYLSNVSPDNGPFTFIQKSKSLVSKIDKYDNLRIPQKTVEDLFEPEDIIEITGSAGTCILIDSTYVHRGKKINKGTRYTYTNYFYEVVQDAE